MGMTTIPHQAGGLNTPQIEGVYNQNRRSVTVLGVSYPIEITASKLVMTWTDNQTVKGEIENGVFYPHLKIQR